jgi:hypothetical protein
MRCNSFEFLQLTHRAVAAPQRSHALSVLDSQRRGAIERGDHVKVIGTDGFYTFLKQAQGMATLQRGDAKSPDEPTLAVPFDRVVSLEHTR